VIGLGVFWILSIGNLFKLTELSKATGRQIKSSGILIPPLLATIAALINPNGIDAFLYPYMLASEPVFRMAISEMISPFKILKLEPLYWTLLLIIIVLAAYYAVRNIKKNPAILFILIIGIISALTSVRNALEFGIITAAVGLITPQLRGLSKIIKSKKIYVYSVVFIVTGFLGYLSINYQKNLRGLGTGFSADLPYNAVDALKSMEYKGNIYAPLGWGGYLIYSGYGSWKVFIDGRLLLYGPDHLNKYHFIRQGGEQTVAVLENSDTDALLVPFNDSNWGIARTINGHPNWKMCYFDDNSLIYLRENEKNSSYISKYGLSKISPFRTGYLSESVTSADSTIILEEAKRLYNWAPDASTTNAVLARMYFLDGKNDLSINHYKKAIEIQPELWDLHYQLARTYRVAELPDSSVSYFEKAIEINPKYDQLYLELGDLEAVRGNYDRSFELWEKASELEPGNNAQNLIRRLRQFLDDKAKE
jgi:tetratricopeptide (TPR) repeat protein